MYNICGLVYNDNPKSRVEKLLIDIINKSPSPTPTPTTLVVDDPSDVGNGLQIVDNTKLATDATNTLEFGGKKPYTSGGLYNQFEKVEMILDKV